MAKKLLNRTCTVNGCINKHAAMGYCNPHYGSIYLREKYGNSYRTFDVESRRESGRLYAAKNSRNPVTLEHIDNRVLERFWSKVDKLTFKESSRCWVWTGAKTANRPTRKNAPKTQGYGAITINKRPFYTHRLSFLMHNGYLTDGLVVDHLCGNTLCVNPDHLNEITNKQNLYKSPNFSANNSNKYAQKSICKYGHKRKPGAGKCESCYKEKLKR
jgi:hypothetical protein